MSNRTDPQQNISGQKGTLPTYTLLAWGTAQAVLAPPVNNTTTVPVTAPSN
jgi:hypothetical protein